MSPILAAVLALAAPPPDAGLGAATPPTATAAPQSTQRTAQDLREAVHQTLRRWARPSNAEADQAAAEFLALYRELDQSDQLSTGQREHLRTRVRTRLIQLAQQIAKREAIRRRLARDRGPAGVALPAGRAHELAQQGGFGGGFGPGMGGGGFGGGGFGAGGFGAGGFGMGGMGMGGGVLGQAEADHGETLVDLIQKTISPGSWDINGGPGSIYYWRPGRAIVVRQTDEVHGRIGDVLQQMGNMGR